MASSSFSGPCQSTNDLVFINMGSQPKIKDDSVHKLVRSHVMKEYRKDKRHQRLQTLKIHKLLSSTPSNASSSQSKSRNTPRRDTMVSQTSRSEAETSSETPSYLNSCRVSMMDTILNPFEGLPIPATPRHLMLLNHSEDYSRTHIASADNFETGVSSSIRTSVHADPTRTYKMYCMRNAAWTFMTISHSAARLEVLKKDSNQESEYYLSRSRAAVGEVISASPQKIDDSTIATVACLTNIAVRGIIRYSKGVLD